MRKALVLILLLSLLVTSTQSVDAQSRARRVGQSAPSAPPPVTSTTTTPANKSAPGGATNNSGNAPAPSAKQVEEEVGENEVVRVNTTLVTIPVSIMDRDGRFIPNLRKEDFRIFEDGTEQEVAYFATTEQPFIVALVLDTSGSTQFKLEDIQDAAIAFVEQLQPDDRVIVISFADDIKVLSEATSDRQALRSAIQRTRAGGSTRLYDAVDYTIKQRLNRIKGRKAIVLFTDGVDTASKRASYDSNVRDAEELDALIYPVQYDTYTDANQGSTWPGSRNPSIILRWPIPFPFPIPGGGGRRGGGGGPGTSRGDYALAGRYLRDMAEMTGGRIFQANDLRYIEQAFSNIAEELRRQYSLGYYPQRQASVAGRRQLKVRVKRPNLVVRARDSYVYKPSGDATAATPEGQRQPSPPPELRRRQFAGNDERGMRNDK